ncbi:hypothetical protein OUZ56_031575 [Daphnia magna]|uniref:Uncharacterized protein n=1 Tax=Daphnia magna TaxID=35525 RepID=A0ABQ9ZV34_9CRUS|nr:hypothetical protein OUZ56_031575 [Daphnia magna]
MGRIFCVTELLEHFATDFNHCHPQTKDLIHISDWGDTASIDSPGRLPSAWLREAGRRAEDLEHFYRSD